MPTTTQPSSDPSRSSGEFPPELLWLYPDQIRPNPWNPNVVPKDLLEKARESLRVFGWLAPVVVRTAVDAGGTGYQLIDGEHRWQIAKEEGLGPIPAFCIDGLSDNQAKKATVILNDLHGQARPDRLADLFKGLLEEISLDELTVGLPYDRDALESLGVQLDQLPSLVVGPLPETPPPGGALWVERTYRMPPDAAEVLDEALVKARGQDEIEPWQALERIAAEFMAS